MAAGAVYKFGPGTWDRVKQAVDMSPKTPQQWARENFGTEDPFVKLLKYDDVLTHLYRDNMVPRAELEAKLRKLRRYFVDVDGSGKDGTLNRVNPLSLPLWMRIAFLPDFVGINTGATQFWQFGGGALYRIEGSGDDRYKPGSYFLYQPVGLAPDVREFVKAFPRIRALLNRDICFEFMPECGGVAVCLAREEDPLGGWLNEPQAFPVAAPSAAAAAATVEVETMPDPLPYEPLTFTPQAHPQGHLAAGYLYFGDQFLDRSAGGHWLKIADLNHTLVMGTSGFGKSVFLNQILEGVHHNQAHFDQVVLVDLKGGVELYPYQARGNRYRVVYRFDDLAPLVAELVTTIEGRLEMMRKAGQRMWPGAKTLFVVDEYAQIQLSPEGTKEERQKKQELLANLNKVSMLGRAAGVLIWAQLQKGTTDVMDSSFRANLSTQVCFKVPNKLTAAGMFGSTDELAVDPVKLPKGRFVLYDATDGTTYYLQARMVA